MKKVLCLLMIFISSQGKANMDFYLSGPLKNKIIQSEEYCPGTTSKAEILVIVKEIIYKDFTDLIPAFMEERIQIREFESTDYFLKTMFKLGHIFNHKRVYYLDINKNLYHCSPTTNALKSILAHEIQHISDYKHANSPELIKLGIKMIGKKSRSAYERSTDFSVMKLGYAKGLIEYREWIYGRLDEKSLRTKKCYYYTPEELKRFLQGELNFSDYYNKYCTD